MKKNVIVFLLFLIVACAYFFNAFINKLLPFDYDIYAYHFPMMRLVKEQYLNNTLPLWNSHMLSGHPLMATAQPGVFYPVTALAAVLFPMGSALMVDLTIHFALSGFFVFLYAKKIGIDDFSSFITGVVFSFMGYFIVRLGFVSIIRTAVWIPLLLYYFDNLRTSPDLINAVKAALVIALQIFAGHPQIWLITYMIILFFIVFYTFHITRSSRILFLSFSCLSFIIGFFIALPQLYATYELYSMSVRADIDYYNFSKNAFPLNRIAGLLFPSFYYGKTEGYIGRLPVLLAATAFVIGRKDIHIRFWAYVAVISMALALGGAISPLNKLMYQLPVYKSFRGFSKHLMEFDLAISLLSGFGIAYILNSRWARKSMQYFLFLLTAVLVISFVGAVIPGLSELHEKAVLAQILFILSCLILSIYIIKSGRFSLFKYIIAITVLIEIVSFRPTKWTPVATLNNYESVLLTDISGKPDRAAFFGLKIIPLLAVNHNINLIEGYDPLIINDYDLLLNLGGIGSWTDDWPRLLQNNIIISMLNTRHITLPPGMSIQDSTSTYKLILNTPSGNMYENSLCLPRAHSVTEVVGFKTTEEIRDALFSKRIDPAKQAAVLMGDLQKIGEQKFADGDVAITEYRDTEVRMRTEFSGAGFIVLADQYYPGWKAYIDNSPAEIYKTNTVLRGIKIPAGKHEIVFKYQPWPIYGFLILSALTLIIIVILLFKWKKSA